MWKTLELKLRLLWVCWLYIARDPWDFEYCCYLNDRGKETADALIQHQKERGKQWSGEKWF